MTNPRTYGQPSPTTEPGPPAPPTTGQILGNIIAWGCVTLTGLVVASALIALLTVLWRVIL